MATTQRHRPWLEALKSAEHERAAPPIAASDSGQTPHLQGAKSAESVLSAADTISSVGFVGASGEVQAGEIAWRVAAMRPQIPLRGPIPFLVARLDLVTPCAPGHCGSCGEPLQERRRYRCAPCQEAAWQVLNEVREGVRV